MTLRTLCILCLITGCSGAALRQQLLITPHRAGTLDQSLTEVSGMASSARRPDLLWMINDGGNPAVLHAVSRAGRSLARLAVAAVNHDWEDLAGFYWRNDYWLAIADIGDNRRNRTELVVHLIREPAIPTVAPGPVVPEHSLRFRYTEGPRDAESIAFDGERLLILTKEIDTQEDPGAVGLYALSIGEHSTDLQTLPRIADLPEQSGDIERRVLRAISGIDPGVPTALDIDVKNHIAYLLTYRSVRAYRRDPGEDWGSAFRRPGKRLYTHRLRQAEALALASDHSLWLTTEAIRAPLIRLNLRTPPL